MKSEILLVLVIVCSLLCSCGQESLPDYYLSGQTPPRRYTTLGKVSASAWLDEPEGGIQKMCKNAKKMGAHAVINITQKKRWDRLSNQEVNDMEGDAVKWAQ